MAWSISCCFSLDSVWICCSLACLSCSSCLRKASSHAFNLSTAELKKQNRRTMWNHQIPGQPRPQGFSRVPPIFQEKSPGNEVDSQGVSSPPVQHVRDWWETLQGMRKRETLGMRLASWLRSWLKHHAGSPAKLVSVRPSVQEVPCSIPSCDLKSLFQLFPFRVALSVCDMFESTDD